MSAADAVWFGMLKKPATASHHLAFELAQARRRRRQIVVHGNEDGELGLTEGVGFEDIGHEASFFLAFGEMGRHVRRQLVRPRCQRGDGCVIARARRRAAF